MILQLKYFPGLISEKSVLSSLWTGHSFFAGVLRCNPNENSGCISHPSLRDFRLLQYLTDNDFIPFLYTES